MRTAPYSVWWAPSGAAVVAMPDRINDVNCARARAALIRAVQSCTAVIIADLTRTDFCGYAATEMLVGVQTAAAEAGARLRLAAAAPNARLIGQIAGAGHRLDIYPDLTAALAGPRSRGTAGIKTATGYRLRLIPGGAARSSPGKPAGRLSAVPSPGQAPPPGPPSAPA